MCERTISIQHPTTWLEIHFPLAMEDRELDGRVFRRAGLISSSRDLEHHLYKEVRCYHEEAR